MKSKLRVMDNKQVDMDNTEWAQYNAIVKEFATPETPGTKYFNDIFDVDEEGMISALRFPKTRQMPWSVVIYMQNLMFNQRARYQDKRIDILEDRLEYALTRLEEKVE